jgi:CubicO group peptidase (beta-lactamase class C family)
VAGAQREHRLPSLTIAVGRAGDTVAAASTGMADAGTGRPAGSGTPYRIGSVTKTFTAALVLLLAERGLLDVEEPVRRYLPAAGERLGRARLRQLLAHSGGVQREVPLPTWATLDGPDAGELLAALPDAELVDGPGVRHHYSNLGYAVLGQVVQGVVGSRCEDLVDRELLEPLRLAATTWTEPADAAVGYRIDPYDDALHLEPVLDLRALGVSGQLWSSAGDLLRWADALCGGAPQVLPDGVTAAMRTPQVMVDRAWTQGWGLGLILDRRDDRVLAGHTGAVPGHLSALVFDPATRTAVAAATNATRGAPLVELATATLLDALRLLPGAAGDDGGRTPAAWTPDPAPPELAGVLGRWWVEGLETVVAWRDGALHAWLAEQPDATRTRFAPEGADRFRAAEGRLEGEVLLVRRDAAGEVTQLEWATYPHTRSPRASPS